jgi:hypothetical protein
MQCPRCNALLEDDTAFCGNCGSPIMPSQAGANATVSDQTMSDNKTMLPPVASRYGTPPQSYQQQQQAERTDVQNSFLQTRAKRPVSDTPGQVNQFTPPVLPQRTATGSHMGRNVLIGLLVLILVAGGTLAAVFALQNHSGSPKKGGTSTPVVTIASLAQVAFVDSQNSTPGQTDALKIAAENLSAPPSGSQYDAWLLNTSNEQILPLGTLQKNGQQFSLNFNDNNTNLIGFGDKIEITQEKGTVLAPTGKVVLSGTFPPNAFIHIRHLLFSFPTTPGKIGLLVGLLNQAQLLNEQAVILKNVASNGNQFAIQCAAQSILDIIEGQHGQDYKQLSTGCASQNITQVGDGFGILGQGGQGYVATASAHASLAANQIDSTANIKLHAGHVEIATANIKGWVTTIQQDALHLLGNPGDTSHVQEIVTLSDHAFHGVDINGDEQIDPVPGEAGAITAYIHGQLMAALPLAR